ncbi:Leucine carboxyl methyltransferase, partial [Nannochloropsis gaditana]
MNKNTGSTTIAPAISRTADTAALCKWSMARHGYLHSVAHVLPSDTIPLLASLAEASAGPSGYSSFRASPLLHWCYATRASAVLRAVQTFLEDKEGDANRRLDKGGRLRERLVVVLGGGMDGLVLALCARAAEATGVGVKVVELDAPEVVARKEGVLGAWREGGREGAVREFLRQTGSYRLEAVDLREGGRVGEVVGEVVREGGGAGREGEAPPDGDGSKGGGQGEVEPQVLFILEAVLGYMRLQEVKILLSTLPMVAPSSSLLIIDTGRTSALKNDDAVAAAVDAAFEARGCSLTGLAGWKDRLEGRREGGRGGGRREGGREGGREQEGRRSDE